MAYINLVKELSVEPDSVLGRQLSHACKATPVPTSSRVYRDTYPSPALTDYILKNIPLQGGNFFDNVLHALSFYFNDNEVYIAYHMNGDAPYVSLLSYNEYLRAQNKNFVQRTIISATAMPAVNSQRLKEFFSRL